MPPSVLIESPKLSVVMITYNHEKFIREALDSALKQQVNFPYEIIVAEDCSTDGTREIVRDYQQRYPDRIRALMREKNIGVMNNFVSAHAACRGKYVAILDGDDFWNDPKKLQKQVDFLDTHPEFAICGHKAWVIYEGSDEKYGPIPRFDRDELAIEDLIHECYLPSLSTVYRRGLFGDYPSWGLRLPMGDWPLHLLNARYGKVKLFPEPMGVYRGHAGGIWSLKSRRMHDQARIEMYGYFDSYFEGRYRAVIRDNIARACFRIAEESWHEGDYRSARQYVRRILFSRLRAIPLRPRLSISARILFPRSYQKAVSALRWFRHSAIS